jgi:cysteine desulfurase
VSEPAPDLIYLDCNATTPVDPRVVAEMGDALARLWGNPSSGHRVGREARLAVERAREQVAACLGAEPGEIVFTSGGSESDNWAILGVVAQYPDAHVIASAVEHPAVLEPLRAAERRGEITLTVVGVDRFGRVDPAEIAAAIAPETVLVSVMLANNEVGTLQPIAEIAAICRARGVLLHTDAAQAVGKVPVDVRALGVDLLTVAGHKVYAPKGVGALFVREGVRLAPLIRGAGHERGLRAGTENVASVVGIGLACELAAAEVTGETPRLAALRDRLEAALAAGVPVLVRHGHPELRLPNTSSVAFPGFDANLLLSRLADEVAASAGAACHTDEVTPSHVLTAMGVDLATARATVRFSVGRFSTEAEVDEGARRVIAVVRGEAAAGGASHESRHPEEHSVSGATKDTEVREGRGSGSSGAPQAPRDSSSALASLAPPRNDSIREAGVAPRDASGGSPPAAIAAAGEDARPAEPVRLTRFTHGLGCACKIQPELLEGVLAKLPRPQRAEVLVGTESSDDACAWRLPDGSVLVQTLDFFTPIVDDPRLFGAIAAANALSDVYAMGARPLFALNIVGFPVGVLPIEVLEEILAGAQEVANEAGIPVLGGHTIEDPEPKFGWVATGLTTEAGLWRNTGARPGDAIVLTKPLGSGVWATAAKRGIAPDHGWRRACAVMRRLNGAAAELLRGAAPHAVTDVTGFGLLGHLHEMAAGSAVDIELWADAVPVLPGTVRLIEQGEVPGGTRANAAHAAGFTTYDAGVPDSTRLVLADAQTSGGLLAAVPAAAVAALLDAPAEEGLAPLVIGTVRAAGVGRIRVAAGAGPGLGGC